jgi:hypothetical protein
MFELERYFCPSRPEQDVAISMTARASHIALEGAVTGRRGRHPRDLDRGHGRQWGSISVLVCCRGHGGDPIR